MHSNLFNFKPIVLDSASPSRPRQLKPVDLLQQNLTCDLSQMASSIEVRHGALLDRLGKTVLDLWAMPVTQLSALPEHWPTISENAWILWVHSDLAQLCIQHLSPFVKLGGCTLIELAGIAYFSAPSTKPHPQELPPLPPTLKPLFEVALSLAINETHSEAHPIQMRNLGHLNYYYDSGDLDEPAIPSASIITASNSYLKSCSSMRFAPIWPQTSARFRPAELGYINWHSVSFSKGCYPGQEIVARTHYLGQPKTVCLGWTGNDLKLDDFAIKDPSKKLQFIDAEGLSHHILGGEYDLFAKQSNTSENDSRSLITLSPVQYEADGAKLTLPNGKILIQEK